MRICVFGAASSLIDRKYTDAAYRTGEALAKAGIEMVFGGGNEGSMGACARGVHSQGGHVTGIIPEFFKTEGQELLYEECDKTIYTEDIQERLKQMEMMSDGFIVLPGGVGTLEEFFDIFVSLCLGRMHKPLTVLNVDGYFDPLLAMLHQCVDHKFLGASRMELFRMFDTEELPAMIEYLRSAW